MGFIAAAASSIFGSGDEAHTAYASPNLVNQPDLLDAIAATRKDPNFVNFNQSNAVNSQQNDLSQALIDQANGKGPSQTQNFLRQATDQGITNQAGLIGSQKGLSPALAARLILQNGATQNQQAAGQGATLAMQEQLDARKQLADTLNAQRTADISQAVQGRQQQSGYEQILQNALSNQNQQNVSSNNEMNSLNFGQGNANASNNQKTTGALIGATGAGAAAALGASTGGKVPGQPETDGDSPANDTVHAMLSPGEIVIPRSKAGSAKKAKEFIDHIMSEKDISQPKGYSKVLKAHKEMDDRISQLEKLCYGGMSGK